MRFTVIKTNDSIFVERFPNISDANKPFEASESPKVWQKASGEPGGNFWHERSPGLKGEPGGSKVNGRRHCDLGGHVTKESAHAYDEKTSRKCQISRGWSFIPQGSKVNFTLTFFFFFFFFSLPHLRNRSEDFDHISDFGRYRIDGADLGRPRRRGSRSGLGRASPGTQEKPGRGFRRLRSVWIKQL